MIWPISLFRGGMHWRRRRTTGEEAKIDEDVLKVSHVDATEAQTEGVEATGHPLCVLSSDFALSLGRLAREHLRASC
jgi:hypothetical protein